MKHSKIIKAGKLANAVWATLSKALPEEERAFITKQDVRDEIDDVLTEEAEDDVLAMEVANRIESMFGVELPGATYLRIMKQ